MGSRDTAGKLTTESADHAGEWSALAAEWTQLGEDWDQRAAAWSARAATWVGSIDARSPHAIEEAKWAAERAREMAAWVRLAAREMLRLTSS